MQRRERRERERGESRAHVVDSGIEVYTSKHTEMLWSTILQCIAYSHTQTHKESGDPDYAPARLLRRLLACHVLRNHLQIIASASSACTKVNGVQHFRGKAVGWGLGCGNFNDGHNEDAHNFCVVEIAREHPSSMRQEELRFALNSDANPP